MLLANIPLYHDEKSLWKAIGQNRIHMTLAHLVQEDPLYARVFRERCIAYKIMDNSLCELEAGHRLTNAEIIECAEKIRANEIVAPDAFHNAELTLDLTNAFIAECPENFNIMGVAQGKDLASFLYCLAEMDKNPRIHCIGLPRNIGDGTKRADYWKYVSVNKPIHLLGAVDARDFRKWPGKEPRSIDTKLPYAEAYLGNEWREPMTEFKLDRTPNNPDHRVRLLWKDQDVAKNNEMLARKWIGEIDE